MEGERAVLALAAAQHGVVTSRQVADAGMSRDEVRHRVVTGRWEPVRHGVYRVGGAPTTWRQALAAACLATGGVASHRGAAALWGLVESSCGVLEVTVPRNRSPRGAGAVLHRSADLSPTHVTVRCGIPATTPVRTVVDLGAVVPAPEVAAALNRAASAGLLAVADVEWFLHDVGRQGRAGAGVVRRVLDDLALGHDPPRDILEPRVRRALTTARLPPAEHAWPVHRASGAVVARVDVAWPEHRVAVTVHGYAPGGRRHRPPPPDAELRALGWRVVPVAWTEVVRSPGRAVRPVAAVLRKR